VASGSPIPRGQLAWKKLSPPPPLTGGGVGVGRGTVVGGVDDDGALSPHDESTRADTPTTATTVNEKGGSTRMTRSFRWDDALLVNSQV
jgi:hypothetical protein